MCNYLFCTRGGRDLRGNKGAMEIYPHSPNACLP